jgi:hypothetical protein
MKLIGTSMKRKEGNYRIERFKVDKYGEIASVEIGCYLDKGGYESKSAILRALNSTWNRLTSDLKKDTGMGLIFSIDIPENISNSFGYFTFCCQFNLDGITSS